MTTLFNKRNRALARHYEVTRCDHAKTALRKRVVKGGGLQYVEQCLRCGESRTNPITRDKAIALNGGSEPPAFDDTLNKTYREEVESGASQIIGEFDSRKEFERAEFMVWYDQYRESAQWKAVRARVLKRANNTCEGCLERPAVLAHHLNYDHVGQEFLFELVALCQECHDRLHAQAEGDGETDGDA